MAAFELYEKYEMETAVSMREVSKLIAVSLEKHYNLDKIALTETGLTIDANLKGFWERAITKATVTITVAEKELRCHVTGTSSLGKFPWLWFVLGFVSRLFFCWFALDVVEYLICRDRPKQYFAETLQALKFKLN